MESTNRLPDKTTEVLIVGAGPSGLMMACQLAIQGIQFRIIDKKENSTTCSGALIMHARSLEIFNQMGISEKVVQESIIAQSLSVIFNGKDKIRISLKNIGNGLTKFPNLYLVEQSKTEQLLIDFVTARGYTVERKTALKIFTQDETGVRVILKHSDGKEETIKTKYLIAADGGNSAIRQYLKIPFVGYRHKVSLFVIDCKAESDLAPEEICFSFSDTATSGIFPLKQSRKRIDGAIPRELEGNTRITFDDIEKHYAEDIRTKISLSKPEWFSVSHSNQRYALSYRQKRCFLVGDAAHVFTPVGAQGMNTGLQDAYNLAWKLAFVIQGKAKETLLNTYSDERQNIAKKAIRLTGKIYNLVTSQNRITKSFRLYLLPYLMRWTLPLMVKQKFLRRFCFNAISEIGINYRKSLLSYKASSGNFPAHAPKPGDRLPYLIYADDDQERNIQEKINGTGFTLFIFIRNDLPTEIINIAEKYKNVLSYEVIPYTYKTKFVYAHFGMENSGCYLIRPDMYIAFRSIMLSPRHLNNYLQQFLKSNP